METLAQIVAEMERKPDAHYLVEWIDQRAFRALHESNDVAIFTVSEIYQAIQAYITSIEES